MDIIIGGNTLEKRKPDPLPLLHAAELYRQQPETSLMVGDSISDVNTCPRCWISNCLRQLWL